MGGFRDTRPLDPRPSPHGTVIYAPMSIIFLLAARQHFADQNMLPVLFLAPPATLGAAAIVLAILWYKGHQSVHIELTVDQLAIDVLGSGDIVHWRCPRKAIESMKVVTTPHGQNPSSGWSPTLEIKRRGKEE